MATRDDGKPTGLSRRAMLLGGRSEGAARIVGWEAVQYVSNIYKYYNAYHLLTERQAQAEAAKAASGAATAE